MYKGNINLRLQVTHWFSETLRLRFKKFVNEHNISLCYSKNDVFLANNNIFFFIIIINTYYFFVCVYICFC